MSSRLLVIQHEATCPPARLLPAAAAAGLSVELVDAGAGDRVPADPGEAAGLVVLGGTMDLADAGSFPHLVDAMTLLRQAASTGLPTLGICLGAELAAQALGGRAYRGALGPEIGWRAVRTTDAGRVDPVTGVLGQQVEAFQWHHDTFDLPPGAELLATGAGYRNQAFRAGSVVAVQFHPEVDPRVIGGWFEGGEDEAAASGTTPAGALDHAGERGARVALLLDAFCRLAAAAGDRHVPGRPAGAGDPPPARVT